MNKLTNRVVIVPYAAQRMGRAMAIAAARRGTVRVTQADAQENKAY
ncbi:hypothetical protein [Paraburkholderia sp.]|nr:hypothetical protein [Paraburkholderia sp.]MDE1180049.1 hypothetical protein [Paraburkholderia sp.]